MDGKILGLCAECRMPQYETPSGPCCENGHGGADTLEVAYGSTVGLSDVQRSEESYRLEKAERTLKLAGYTDCGGELWKPPLGEKLKALQKPDEQLCKFYNVETYEDLVAAMERHIKRLQDRLYEVRHKEHLFTKVREG